MRRGVLLRLLLLLLLENVICGGVVGSRAQGGRLSLMTRDGSGLCFTF